ncbi:MAG: beta-ketoacyl-[acyl-carrier-protein] synthase family protein [Tepidisphaerales bacterium]
MKQRVVITGMGVVSPVGSGREKFWAGLTAGRSGIGPVTLFDVSTFPVRIAGEVKDLDAVTLLQRFPQTRGERDRKILLGLAAAAEAVADAGFSWHGLPARVPRYAAASSLDHLEESRSTADVSEYRHHGLEAHATYASHATDALRAARLIVGVGLEAFFLEDLAFTRGAAGMAEALMGGADGGAPKLQTPLDRLATLIGDAYAIGGGRFTNCSACAAGAQAIGQAFRDVRRGAVEVALAGASDSMLNPLGLGGFSLLRVLSAENDRPAEACRPFDVSRVGTVLGEGAAFMLLESLEHAAKRGARVYAEIIGYGSSLDAYRVSDPEPDGRGAVLSMNHALRDAGLAPGEIDCVNAHGTGTPKNDIVETAAIKQVHGERARRIPVHAVKSMTGHMIAASGAAEAVAAALTLHYGVVPPTINLHKPDPACDLDYVPNEARPFDGQYVLSNSFGFGGQNATIIFRKARL